MLLNEVQAQKATIQQQKDAMRALTERLAASRGTARKPRTTLEGP